MEHTVEITMVTWLQLLEDRRENILGRGWTIPDCVWNYAMELFEDCGAPGDPEKCNPSIVVDNIAINGDYRDFDDYKRPDESDEEFIARVEDEAMAVFPEERIVLYSL